MLKLRYTTSPRNSSLDQACTKKPSTNTCRECNVLGHWVDREGIADELKATIPVLQGQQPRDSNSTSSSLGLLAFAFQKGTAKEQGHGRKSYKVFSLNPLYQIEEDMLVFYARNIYFPQKEHGKGTSKRGKKKHVASKSFRSWIWRHPNKQPCNRPNRAETKREKAKDARKKSLDEVSAKHTTWILT